MAALLRRSLTYLALLCASAAAQSRPTNPPKEIRFEVLSIRPATPAMNIAMNSSPSPNGFDTRLSLWQLIMVAYGPVNSVNWGSVEVLKAPNWIGDFYDVKARVSPSDL